MILRIVGAEVVVILAIFQVDDVFGGKPPRDRLDMFVRN